MIAKILVVLILVSTGMGAVAQDTPVAVQIHDRDRDRSCLGEDPEPSPGVQRLADEYGVAYEELVVWFCAGYGIGEIENALWTAEQTGMTLEEVFAMHDEVGNWGQLWQDLGLVGKDRDEDVNPGKGDYCVGAAAHPAAEALAEEYEATYEQIMEWFCEDGFGFGEIKIALEAGERLGMDPGELLTMKDDLKGWGQVWQELGTTGRPKDDRPGKSGTEGNKPEEPGNSDNSSKPETPGNPESGQPDQPGNPESGQPDQPGNSNPGKPDESGQPDKGSSGKKNG